MNKFHTDFLIEELDKSQTLAERIADMAKFERPREKLMRYGAQRLTLIELLAILLRTGTRKSGVLTLAEEVHRLCGGNLQTLTAEKLSKISGIGSVKICEILSCVEIGRRLQENHNTMQLLTPESVWHMVSDIRDKKKEHFVALYLDSRNVFLHKEIVSIGILNSSIVHPREAFEPALRVTAAAVIFAHNHPSHTLEPSDADIKITDRLIKVGELLGIPVLDHIIVTNKSFMSMKEERVCEFK